MRLEHLLSGAMLSLYDSAMNCTIYLEKWYVKESKFRVLHYVVYDIIQFGNRLKIESSLNRRPENKKASPIAQLVRALH